MAPNRARVMHEWIWSPPGRDKSSACHRPRPQVRLVANGNASIRARCVLWRLLPSRGLFMDSRRIENHFTLEAEAAKINSNATAFADPVVFQQAILSGVKITSSLQYFTSVICLSKSSEAVNVCRSTICGRDLR